MVRFLFVIALVLVASPRFGAAGSEHDACTRDVVRHCRAVMNDGDSAVLACLQQHRTRISKACNKVLTEHGQ